MFGEKLQTRLVVCGFISALLQNKGELMLQPRPRSPSMRQRPHSRQCSPM